MENETFGSGIRRMRENNHMPLRKLAAFLDIDQSTLSKIETNQRHPTKEMIPILSEIFKVDIKDLTVKFLSEKILYELQDQEHGLEALKLAEETISYSINKR